MKRIQLGDQVTVTHETYGTITGRAHGGRTGWYLPLGIGYINLTDTNRYGWRIVDVCPVPVVLDTKEPNTDEK